MAAGSSSPSPIRPPSDNWAGGAAPGVLSYSNLRHARPGLVTALGILSIIIGSLGLLSNLWGTFSWGIWLAMPAAMPAPPAAAGAGRTGTAITPAGAITTEDADVIVQALNTTQPLPPTHQKRLSAALAAHDLPLAPPPNGKWTTQHVTSQIQWSTGATPGPAAGATPTTAPVAGAYSYSFPSGSIDVDAAGTVTLSTWAPDGTMSTATISGNSTTTTSFNASAIGLGGSRWAILLGVAANVLGFLLAGMLLAAGIMALRSSPRTPRMHRWWAWLKILVTLVGAVATGWWMSDLFNDFGSTVTVAGPGQPTNTAAMPAMMAWVAIIPALMVAILGLAYPVAVLIVLRTRTVREYFGQVTDAEAMV